MRIFFALSQPTLLRHFVDVVLELTRRGHEVIVCASDRGQLPSQLVGVPGLSRIIGPEIRSDAWQHHITIVRTARDYLRYRHAEFEGATKLRARALRLFVKAMTHEAQTHAKAKCPACRHKVRDDELIAMMLEGFGRDSSLEALETLLTLVESSVPPDPELTAFLAGQRADVVLVTPLVTLGSGQPDLVKCARHLGIPVLYPVFSWDNLSTKGVIHVQPDALIVWNDVQVEEAVRMHGVPRERVFAVGAPRFDRFLALPVAESRAALCARHGLDPSRPILAYVCSSELIADAEPAFVREWITAVRSDERVANCGIVIRPHPRAVEGWEAFDRTPWSHVAVGMPTSVDGDQSLRDLCEHASAVIGLNTSAELEAGLIGRPVLSVLAPDARDGQQGTLHFGYLLKEQGGFVELGRTMAEHLDQLSAVVNGQVDHDAIRGFMERFVRPAGWSTPVSPLVADTIERLARVPSMPAHGPAPQAIG